MILQVYLTASEFLEKAQNYLLQDEAINNLMLGLAVYLKHQPETDKPPSYMATVEQGSQFLLAALMTPPRSVILFSPGEPDREACEVVARDLQSGGWQVVGVNAVSPLSAVFAETWQELTGCSYRPWLQMHTYKLERVVWPEPMPPGRLRQAVPEDIPWAEDWLFRFHKEALKLEDRQAMHRTAEDVISSHSLHVWEDDGHPVSMASGRRPSPHGIVIAMVYTPPEFRGRGYASACVASLCQYYLDSGKSFCSLFADLENPTSNHIYQRIGFQWIGNFTEYRFLPEMA
ncbi:MAG: GNAT family N-acetyltransferase [Anaerolineae bacterium]|nr:GNAT family N-acetyltransferase [Anaerolineae bacterium]